MRDDIKKKEEMDEIKDSSPDSPEEERDPEPDIEWMAPEYPFSKKSKEWYMAVVIITGSISISAFIVGNALFGILIILATFTLLLYASRKPDDVEIHLTEGGLIIGPNEYPFSGLMSFWIDDSEIPARLILKPEKKISSLISIQIVGLRSEEVREFIEQFLPEEEMHEPPLQKIMEKVGF